MILPRGRKWGYAYQQLHVFGCIADGFMSLVATFEYTYRSHLGLMSCTHLPIKWCLNLSQVLYITVNTTITVTLPYCDHSLTPPPIAPSVVNTVLTLFTSSTVLPNSSNSILAISTLPPSAANSRGVSPSCIREGEAPDSAPGDHHMCIPTTACVWLHR